MKKQWKTGKLGMLLCCAALMLPCINAYGAEEPYPVTGEKETAQEGACLELLEDAGTYTVLPGDSLWKIAEKLLGSGYAYTDLIALNQDCFADPDLIYPGTVLRVGKKEYILRKEAAYGGVQMGKYSMDMPHDWTAGAAQSGNAAANFVMSGDGMIACLVRDKEENAFSASAWEQCTQQIAAYAKENYPLQVSDLQFEHYSMNDQGDASGEVYLYSYIWHISPEEYPYLTCQISAGLKQTEHVQAEFIGYAFLFNDIGDEYNYDIHSCVRYVTASFEEHFKADGSGAFTVNDSNMKLVPDEEWEVEGMFNSFAYIEEFFAPALEALEDGSYTEAGKDGDSANKSK